VQFVHLIIKQHNLIMVVCVFSLVLLYLKLFTNSIILHPLGLFLLIIHSNIPGPQLDISPCSGGLITVIFLGYYEAYTIDPTWQHPFFTALRLFYLGYCVVGIMEGVGVAQKTSKNEPQFSQTMIV